MDPNHWNNWGTERSNSAMQRVGRNEGDAAAGVLGALVVLALIAAASAPRERERCPCVELHHQQLPFVKAPAAKAARASVRAASDAVGWLVALVLGAVLLFALGAYAGASSRENAHPSEARPPVTIAAPSPATSRVGR